MPYISKLF